MAAPGESNVVPLTGDPVFPSICVNCCAPAQQRLTVAQTFPGNSVVSFQPFFCAQCIAAHRAERKPDPTLFFRRLLHGWALWIPVLGSSWALSAALPSALQSIEERDPRGLVISGGLAGFFALIAIGCVAAIWHGSRHLAVKAPTRITSAMQFSRDLSQTFEPEWRRFTLRNSAYAQQFLEANRARLWTRGHPKAQRALVLRHYGKYVLYAVLAVLAVFAVADEFGYSLWDVIRNLGK